MIGVSSLATLANQVSQQAMIISALDARMGEVYWGVYHRTNTQLTNLISEQVSKPCLVNVEEIVHKSNAPLIGVGNAWNIYEGEFDNALSSIVEVDSQFIYPDPKGMLSLAEEKWIQGDVCEAKDFSPVYVRNDVAKKSTKPLL